MDILLLLVPLSVVLVFLAAWAFRWSLDHDQFEDLERHGRSILDDESPSAGNGDPAGDPAGDRDKKAGPT